MSGSPKTFICGWASVEARYKRRHISKIAFVKSHLYIFAHALKQLRLLAEMMDFSIRDVNKLDEFLS